MKKKKKDIIEPNKCSSDNVPTDNEILKYNEMSKDGWMVSYHPFCKSCYEVYKMQCKEIERMLDIETQGDLISVSEIHNKIIDIIKRTRYEIEYIHELEHYIKTMTDCITSRLFHHNSCYTPPHDDLLINLNVIKTNEGHNEFLKDISVELKNIYYHYKNALGTFNIVSPVKHENVFLKYKLNTLDIIRNIIKNYGSADDKEDIDIIFDTPSKKQLKCKGSIRKTRKAQQSRTNESYLIYKEDMDRILKKHPPKTRSKENSKKYISLKKKHNKNIKKYFVENLKR